jgi:hypothetical protein
LRSLRAVTGYTSAPIPRRAEQEIEQHLRDKPKFCPGCGGAYAGGITVEYWEGPDRMFHCWCPGCLRSHEIAVADRVIGHEPEH